jgi:S1-C subfamily serine protease
MAPILDVVDRLRAKKEPEIRHLGVEFEPISVVEARRLGLPEEWATKLMEASGTSRSLLMVCKIAGGCSACELLSGGDILLAINGVTVTSFREAELACLHESSVQVTVHRDGEELTLAVETVDLDAFASLSKGDNRFVSWAGAIITHIPYSAAHHFQLDPRKGAYIASISDGSPCSQAHKMRTGGRIMEVNGEPTPTLEKFVEAVLKVAKPLGDKKAAKAGTRKKTKEAAKVEEEEVNVMVKMETLSRKTKVASVTLDLHFWPTFEMRWEKKTSSWERHDLQTRD